MRIDKINDGDSADIKIIQEYGIEQLCSNGKYQFVGFINKHDNILVSCPKNFTYTDPSDIQLIVKCIIKSFKRFDKGSSELLDCNIPLRPYLIVLDYYYKYGIYKSTASDYKQDYAGRIDWNRTIRNSQKVVNGNNLLFLPFEIKQVKRIPNFITECMKYVINDGFEQFGKYVGLGIRLDTEGYLYNFKNSDVVIRQLKAEEGRVFKDLEIQLIRALISYFDWEGSTTEQAHLLTKSFEVYWQDMVDSFLNKNFAGYDRIHDHIIFENGCKKYSFIKEPKTVDLKDEPNRIEFDHISIDNVDGLIYLFDSKYYSKINELNYKQVAYHYFLMRTTDGVINYPCRIVNGLILPTSDVYYSKVHIDRRSIDGVYICEHYVNIRTIMTKFIS